MKKNILSITILLIITPLLFCKSQAKANYHEGDLIFNESRSVQSRYIKLITGSRYTHMGILFKLKGKWFVYEAVQPVQYTPLLKWIDRGKNRRWVARRLKNANQIITPKVIRKMKQIGHRFYRKNYDTLFQWSDKRIYCSELVWKIYKRALGIEIGSPQNFKDFDLSHPEVKKLIKRRYGKNISLEEKVITPVRMFESDKLEIIMDI